MGLGRIAGAVGKGLAAGAAGTVAMTVSSTAEMKLRKRESSPTPGRALERVLHVVPESPEAEQRLSQVGHFGYGVAWGGARGLLGGLGLPGPVATALHGLALWGSEQVILPKLEISPPAWEWGAREVAVDAWHHLVYVAATDVAYRMLDRD